MKVRYAVAGLFALAIAPAAQATQVAGIQLNSGTFIADNGNNASVSYPGPAIDPHREGVSTIDSVNGTVHVSGQSHPVATGAEDAIRVFTEITTQLIYTGLPATLTFFAVLDGELFSDGGGFSNVDADLSTLNDIVGSPADSYAAQTPPGGGTVFVDEVLQISFDVLDGQTFRVFSSLSVRPDASCSLALETCFVATADFANSMTLFVDGVPDGGLLTNTNPDENFIYQTRIDDDGGSTDASEPAMLGLLGLGLLGLAIGRRRG
ncbi:MAG: hypothetical protein RIM84_11925 [Alphaproteobacteria bacterium]